MSIKALQDYTVYAKYARYDEEKQRRETWEEQIDRVFGMHERKYAQQLEENEDFKADFKFAKEQVLKKRVLGSQRALQFGGDPIERANAKMFNCFDEGTEFITSDGVRTFKDYQDGDTVKTLTHEGRWKLAVVKAYGHSNLNKITISRGNTSYIEYATSNHRWILKDGTVTDSLKVGDRLNSAVNIFMEFDYDSATPEEKLYWCYGYVYGDGTRVMDKNGDYKYSMVRLCGKDVNYESRFTDLGFKSSSSLSINGDIICHTGKYLKTSPNPEVDSPELIRAFVHGYLAADGEKNSNKNKDSSPYRTIQSSDLDHINFIKKCFPIAGMYIVSQKDLTGQKTNLETRGKTVLFRINCAFSASGSHDFVVSEIELNYKRDVVWCLEVEDDYSFTLPYGLTTGNCIVSYCDRPRFFQECMYLLLCGCGTGFSVQGLHVDKLPEIAPRTKGKKLFMIPDSIEGWADALGALVNSYFVGSEFSGYEMEFDYSLIRPEGALIRGGFKAPGHQGLKLSLEKIAKLVDARLEVCFEDGVPYLGKLRPIDAYDIIMHASDAVLSGGVRRSATICIFSHDDEEMLNAKTGSWFVENPQRGRSNNSALLVRDKTTKEQFTKIMQSVKEFGEPAFVWAEDEGVMYNPCVEIGFFPSLNIENLDEKKKKKFIESSEYISGKTRYSGWQACVSGDTKLITKTGVETIKDVVGKEIEIWNGNKWCPVTPFITGTNRDLYRVYLSDGSFLDCTDNHKWLVKDRFMSDYKTIETKDLMSVSKYKIHTPRADIKSVGGSYEEFAYEYGFVLGYGTARINHSPFATLFGEDFNLNLRGVIGETKKPNEKYSIPHAHITFENLNNEFSVKLKYEKGLPKAVFTWDEKSIIQFISGWIDADGSKANLGCRLYGEYSKLSDAQLLLSKIGVNCSINLHTPTGFETNMDMRNRALHYLQISNATKLKSRRINLSEGKVHNGKGKFQVIERIEKLEGKHTTYCLTEEENHTCVFNNVLTQQCNLCEINGRKIKSLDDFKQAARAASIIGTLQAGYTEFKYLGLTSQFLVEQEALLGVSMTGMMDSPEVLFDPDNQKAAAKEVLDVNEVIARCIGINRAARATCVKPAGSTSCVLGSSSGIHPHHSRRYFRRVQANKLEFPAQEFMKHNPAAVESSVWSNSGTDMVITFLCEVPQGSIIKNQLSAIELLNKVMTTQQNWVEAGTRADLGIKDFVRHNVSNTITVKPEEWDDITDFIFENRYWFAGISLLPASGDKDYPQAPFCSVPSLQEYARKYGEAGLFASGLVVDGLSAFNGNLWAACDSALGIGEQVSDEMEEPTCPARPVKNGYTSTQFNAKLIEYSQALQEYYNEQSKYDVWWYKKDWLRRAEQFADRYFEGDIRQMTYCLKDCSNIKLWNDLSREYVDIDWSTVIEKEVYLVKVDETAAAACAGGACDLGV